MIGTVHPRILKIALKPSLVSYVVQVQEAYLLSLSAPVAGKVK